MADLSQYSTEELMAMRGSAQPKQSVGLAGVDTETLLKARKHALENNGEIPGFLESATRGAVQGVTLGLSDEIYGGAKAAGGIFAGDFNVTDNYQRFRDEERAANKKAQEANPKTYLGANIVAGAVVPGGAALKGATLAGKVARGAAMGAGLGFGESEADVLSGEMAGDVAKGAAYGAGAVAGTEAAIKGLKGISKGIGALGRKTGLARPKADAEYIQDAAKAIGAEATPGQLFDSPNIQARESVLAQATGSIGGRGLRKQIRGNQEAAKGAAESIVKDASGTTAFEVGQKVEMQLTEDVAKKLKPAEDIYGFYENKFRLMKPKTGELRTFAEEMKDEFKFDDDALKTINDFQSKLTRVKNLDDLKKLRSTVGAQLRVSEGTERQALGEIYGRLTAARSEALISRAQSLGDDAYMTVKKNIEKADKIYRDTIGEVNNVFMQRGRPSPISPKRTAENFFSRTPEGERIAKILKTNDPAKIEGVKRSFPEAFEQLRAGMLEDISQRSELKGEVNPRKLVKIVKGMQPETANLIFGADGVQKAKALSRVLDSIPEKVGPSGTPAGHFQFTSIADPKFYFDQFSMLSKEQIQNFLTNPTTGRGWLLGAAKRLDTPRARGAAVFGANALIPRESQRSPLLPAEGI